MKPPLSINRTPRLTYASGKSPVNLVFDLRSEPGTALIVGLHLVRSPRQHLMGELRWDSTCSGECADCEALAIKRRLLFSERCGDDSAARTIERRLGIGAQPGYRPQRPTLNRLFGLAGEQGRRHVGRRHRAEIPMRVPPVAAAGRRRDDVSAITAPIEPGPDTASMSAASIPQTTGWIR